MLSKIWIFFKLRMLQLRYDKTALFFSYFLPVILLTGIGYPLEMAGKKSIGVHYTDYVKDNESRSLVNYLDSHKLINMIAYDGDSVEIEKKLNKRKIDHVLVLAPAGSVHLHENKKDFSEGELGVVLYSNDSNTQQVQSLAVGNYLHQYFKDDKKNMFIENHLSSGAITSYIVTLLPGLIGMTLLTIGLNGFGGVLIVEREGGLFHNIKTIDASPVAFLAGLFLSRLFVCYTVAAALFLVGVFMFGLTMRIDFSALFVIVTLGCISFLGIGLVISVFSKSVSSYSGIVNFVNIPFVVFSGVFFSTTAFPEWLQTFTQIIPLTHMNTAVRAILFDHAGWATIAVLSKELTVLGIWCFLTIFIGLKQFKW